MRIALFLFLSAISLSAMAMPITCESTDVENGKPVLRFKVNPKRPVLENGNTWDLFLVGVTPSEGFRFTVYASGIAGNKQLSITFVKNGFVLGSGSAQIHNDGSYYGEANVSGVKRGKKFNVVCVDNKVSK